MQNLRVRFNKEYFPLALGCHNGRELRELFAVKADHALYLSNRDDFSGDDTLISDDDNVDVIGGDKFYSFSQKINGGGD